MIAGDTSGETAKLMRCANESGSRGALLPPPLSAIRRERGEERRGGGGDDYRNDCAKVVSRILPAQRDLINRGTPFLGGEENFPHPRC